MVYTTRCRLCLEGIKDNNFISLEDFERNMLETLTPLINVGISSEPKICDKCGNSLQTAYDLKALWLGNNERVKKLLILREIYPEPCKDSCCLCGHVIIDEMDDKYATTWKEMIERCIPELDIYTGKHVSACKNCVDDLKCVHVFLNNSLQVEDKIKDYCIAQGKGEISLFEVFKYNSTVECNDVQEQREVEETVESNRETIVEPSVTQSNGKIGEKLEEKDHQKGEVKLVVNADVSSNIPGSSLQEQERSTKEQCFVDVYKESNKKGDNDPKITNSENICHTNKPPELDATKQNTNDPKVPRKGKKPNAPDQYSCDQCPYVTKYKSALISHWVRHKDPSQMTMYKCHECGHQTKRKADLRAHTIIHRNPTELRPFPCPYCPYRAIRNGDLKQHLFTHEYKRYKCQYCSFVTNNEKYLTTGHYTLQHKDLTGHKTFKCTECSYQSYVKRDLRIHSLSHKSKSELVMYKCNWCQFETRYKTGLRTHMLTHTCPSELEFFECYTCGYKAKRKKDLKNHIDRHYKYRLPSLFCANCNFETKSKRSLVQHMSLHLPPSQGPWFKCEVCDFQARRKRNVKTHMWTHNRREMVSQV